MSRSRRIILVVSSLAIAALLLFTVEALAVVVENVHNIPVNGTVFNPCNGETVTFNGVAHVVASVTLDGSGGFHLDARDNIHVTATGSLGNSYEGNEEDLFQLNGRVGIEQTVSTTFSEISKGAAPNFEIHALLHITVNANGTTTAFIDNFTSSCRG